jgi:hypothetical protein
MADLGTMQRDIYQQQRATWQPVEEALLDDYNDFSGRQNRVAAAGATAQAANAGNIAVEGRQLARFGGMSPDGQAYRQRLQELQGAKDVVTARSLQRQTEEAGRIDTGLALTQIGGGKLRSGMSSLAVADAMRQARQQKSGGSKAQGVVGGMASGAATGSAFGWPGAIIGGVIGGGMGYMAS